MNWYSAMRYVMFVLYLGIFWQFAPLERPSKLLGQESAGRKYAILVGVSQYDKNQLRNLAFAENDVAEMAEILKQSGFRRVELLTQAEGAKESRYLPLAKTVRETIRGMLEDRNKDDLVLIAFAGHGVQFKGEKENYFCPMDAVLTDRTTLISLTDVYDQLKQSKAGSKLLLVDACRNDPLAGNARAAADVQLQSLTRPQIPDPPGGVAAFFSCSEGQRAFEDDALKHGVFFHHVILGLKGEARLKKQDEVTWDSLVAYVKAEVPDTVKQLMGNTTRQIPENRGDLRGGVTLISFKSPQSPTSPTTPSPSNPPPTSGSGTPINFRWPFTADQAKMSQESWAKALGKNVVEKNSLGMEFMLIPPGKFTMGSPPDEKDRGKHEDQVEVTLISPFWLGRTEVTQSQWLNVMGQEPWQTKQGVKEGPDYAASFINLRGAQEFIKRLSKLDGVTYRLPTDAEWEWSCRAGTSSRWSFGDNETDIGRYGWVASRNSKDDTEVHEVGKKLANPFGLSDMHGNVWELCDNLILPGGTNPNLKKHELFVFRGGSHRGIPSKSRSANRAFDNTYFPNEFLGLRIARTIEVTDDIIPVESSSEIELAEKDNEKAQPAKAVESKKEADTKEKDLKNEAEAKRRRSKSYLDNAKKLLEKKGRPGARSFLEKAVAEDPESDSGKEASKLLSKYFTDK